MGPEAINFNKFKVKCPNYRESFETLCYHLFLREHSLPNGIKAHFNEPGLETVPVNVAGKWIGFQSKFFEPSIDYGQIEKSVKTAIKRHGSTLDVIYIYLNLSPGSNGTKKTEIETFAKDNSIEIKWVTPSVFEAQLLLPSNYDLAQIFFGAGDELSFASSLSPRIITFLKSREFQSIPFLKENKPIKDFEKSILSGSNSVSLIVGHPGSGKSYYLHRLQFVMGGMHKNNQIQQKSLLEKNGALPMLINLKDCLNQSIESIIRDRQNDYNIRRSPLGFNYIFDGLDELPKDKADSVLSAISDLETSPNTKKIIVSCRSGNPNRYIFKKYFTEGLTYEIDNLEKEHISKYFEDLEDKEKIALLQKYVKEKLSLLNEINDIFLLKLFWDTIETIDENHSIINLFELKISQMMSDAKHQKNIHSLNLLNPKETQLTLLNQEISYEFQKKFQYRFSNSELQEIIHKKFPLLAYEDINKILDYLCSHFFVASGSGDDTQNNTYIYQHRRYQEFFFVQKLKREYEQNRKVLRSKFLANKEFIEEIFLPYLKQKYLENENLPRLLEISLIEVYLGRHQAFGADDPYFEIASNFSKAVAYLDADSYEEVINDENLDLKEKIPASIKNIKLFWESKKKDTALALLDDFEDYRKTAKHGVDADDPRMEENLQREIWDNLEDWFYLTFTFYKNRLVPYFKKTVRPYFKKYADDKDTYSSKGTRGEQLLASFFRFCIINNVKDWSKLLQILNDDERVILTRVCTDISLLEKVLKDKTLLKVLKKQVSDEITVSEQVTFLFYKKLFNITLTESEVQLAEDSLDVLRNERPVDWHFRNTQYDYALISFALNKFKESKKTDSYRLSYYNELILYTSIFHDYVSLLRSKKKNIGRTIRSFITYSNNHEEPRGYYLTYEISKLWSHIFVASADLKQRLLTHKTNLFSGELNVNYFSFLLIIKDLDQDLYRLLTNETEIDKLSEKLNKWEDDIPQYVEYCFSLSILYSSLNSEKSQQFIAEGIYEGILRHGWRKDSIVSFSLVDALELIMRNNWMSSEDLSIYIDSIFQLTIRVTDITDGKGTWQGPYNLIKLVAKYDITKAQELRKKLAEEKGEHNVSLDADNAILVQKVYRGIDIADIQDELADVEVTYGYRGKPQSDSFEHKIKVWLTLAEEDLYTASEKRKAFENAYSLVEELLSNEVDYFLDANYYEQERAIFTKLCKKYKKKNLLKDVSKSTSSYKKPKTVDEKQILKEIKSIKTKRALRGFYTRLANYRRGVVLRESESWKTLIDKTYQLYGNIDLLFEYFKEKYYPHSEYMTNNSERLHYALAYAIQNIKTRNQTLEFLYRNGGYQGFLNTMKSFEVIGDKKMCLKLFKEFHDFCDFLVN